MDWSKFVDSHLFESRRIIISTTYFLCLTADCFCMYGCQGILLDAKPVLAVSTKKTRILARKIVKLINSVSNLNLEAFFPRFNLKNREIVIKLLVVREWINREG